MERIDLTKYGYIKSVKTLDDGTPIYFPESINSYWKEIYETFISESTGEKQDFVIRRDHMEYEFTDEDITCRGDFASHKLTNTTFRFQFNLYEYLCFIESYVSAYHTVGNILRYDGCGGMLYNERPVFTEKESRISRDLFQKSGYYPFYECCFATGNHYTIENYIPDKLFFNFKDRKKAIEGITTYHCGRFFHNPTFDNIDYVNMTDHEVIKFMNERMDKRIEFEKLIKY
jgi:hypothetical protein